MLAAASLCSRSTGSGEGKWGQIPPRAALGPFSFARQGAVGHRRHWSVSFLLLLLLVPLSLPPALCVCMWVCVSLGVLLWLLNLQKPPSCGGAEGFGGAAGALRTPPFSERLVFCIS